ncbi:MAG TPA: preprotein translocase subunit SecE [Egibacteraceae bacterium]|nr:preprotein translocase subunit SecE [Egibacteraceae bacterium]
MSREFKRDMERQKRRAEKEVDVTAEALPETKKKRTSPRQFTREIRGELKRVVWPSRKEVASYSIVVLVAVAVVTLFIFGLDQLFGEFALRIFS